MYGWIFSRLPGPLWVRVLLAAVMIVVAVAALMEIVFPWAAQFSPLTSGVTLARE
jgi:hypothetical protein